MKITLDSYRANLYSVIEHGGIMYTREEAIMETGFHTIAWYTGSKYDENIEPYILHHYFSHNIGWNGSDGMCSPENKTPHLEKLYQYFKK